MVDEESSWQKGSMGRVQKLKLFQGTGVPCLTGTACVRTVVACPICDMEDHL